MALIIPELRVRRIIGQSADLELVKVSLVATMIGLGTMVYDGLGTTFLFGSVINRYGFNAAWRLNSIPSASILVVVLFGYLACRWLAIKPKIIDQV